MMLSNFKAPLITHPLLAGKLGRPARTARPCSWALGVWARAVLVPLGALRASSREKCAEPARSRYSVGHEGLLVTGKGSAPKGPDPAGVVTCQARIYRA